MIIVYSITGLVLASIGGVASGASNLAVVTTTTKHSLQKAMKIAVGAGVGEITLVLLALYYSTCIADFIEMNRWVQIMFTSLFLLVGLGFYFSEKLHFISKPTVKKHLIQSSYIKGFILGFVNPPVLLFWMLGISFTQKHLLPLTDMSPTFVLVLFFTGVFLGKVGVLYEYAKIGETVLEKKNKTDSNRNKMIGFVLSVLAFVQFIKLFV